MRAVAKKTLRLLTLTLSLSASGIVGCATELLGLNVEDSIPIPVVVHVPENSDKYFIKHSYIPDPAGNLLPWSIHVVDHDVWIYGEFADSLHVLKNDGSGGYDAQTTGHLVPIEVAPPWTTNGPFSPHLIFGTQAKESVYGEKMVEDDEGRIWFTQGSASWGSLEEPSYSRVVSYDTDPLNENPFCVYNVPDNGSMVIGIDWDDDRGLIWFTQSSPHGGIGSIISFDPAVLTACANEYLWKYDANNEPEDDFEYDYCSSPTEQDCFRKYTWPAEFFVAWEQFTLHDGISLPNGDYSGTPSHLVVAQAPHPDAGAVWFTLFNGDAIGRLDPDAATGAQISFFEVGEDPYSSRFVIENDLAPWDIDINTITQDIVFVGSGGKLMGRFDVGKYKSASYAGECEEVTGNGVVNPCMQLMRVPRMSAPHGTHSMDIDEHGNTWFSISSEGCIGHPGMRHEPVSIGFIDKDWTEAILFDYLDFSGPLVVDAIEARFDDSGRLDCAEIGSEWSITGIDTDVDDSDEAEPKLNIWFTDSGQGRIRRLEYRFDPSENIYCKVRDCN
jgi:hypothetical protein